MVKAYKSGVVLKNKELFPNVYIISVDIKTDAKPGQFCMVRNRYGDEPLLPRPLSIASIRNGCIAFLYEVKGKGTHLMANLKVGDKLEVLGPLGKGFNIQRKGRVAMVSGGLGIAPMLSVSEELGKLSNADLICGFRTGSYYTDYIEAYTRNVEIATEDGSVGTKGLVTDILKPELYDFVYTCGPTPMMKAVYEKCKGIVPVQVSLENRMACGIGSCLGCSVMTSEGMKRVCKDGPVFMGEEIFYE